MITDSEKIRQLRTQKGLSQGKLADELSVSRSLIIAIENGERTISLKLLKKIQEVYQIDLYSISEDSVKCFDSNLITIPVHDISASAGAGTWLADEPPTETLYFDKRFLKPHIKKDDYSSLHFIYAKGDSMDSGWNQPEDIKDGDMLLVDTSQVSGNYQTFVIIVNNQELRVKQLLKQGDTLHIISRNPKYKTEIYRPDDTDVEIRVIGRVVWNGSKENV